MIPTLRPYQDRMIESLRGAFRAQRRVLCVLPTGGGKTVVGSTIVHLAVARSTRVLWLAHRTELIEQASAKLGQFEIPHAIIKAGHPRHDLAQPVQVASVQTVVRRLDRLTRKDQRHLWGDHQPSWMQPFGLVVVDEAHHTTAGTYVAILEAYPDAKVLGLTATPYRLDGSGLGAHYDHLVVGAHVSELIREGFLVPTRTYAPPAAAGLDGVHTRAGDYAIGEAARVLDAAAPIDEIVRTWRQRAADRLTVGFACNVAHAAHLAQAFRAAGVAAAAIDGDTDQAERDDVLARLAAGELRVVWNCALLTEGWDLPSIGAVVLARPTKSRALWRQMVGRGMRSAPGKSDCLVLDHAANAHRFGVPDADDQYHLQQELRREGGTAPKCVICPSCYVLNGVHEPACTACGRDLRLEAGYQPRRFAGERSTSLPEVRKAIELDEFRGLTEDDRRRLYQEWLAIATNRGYRPGWAAHRYLERFGGYPPHAWRRELETAHV